MPLLLALLVFPAHAALDALSGARVSLATTQQMLAAPFLPNLSSEHGQFGTNVSYLTATLKGAQDGGHYLGRFKGYGVGASYSPAVKSDVGYYVTGVYSQNEGTAALDLEPQRSVTHAFSTTGFVGNLGGSLRLLGGNSSGSIIGIFGGPAFMQFDSRLQIQNDLFTSSPFIYGVTVGAQWRLHLGAFVFNPYALRFEAFTNACTGVSAAGGVSFPEHCPGDEAKVALMPSFNAYGLVFGFRKLEANVYAKLLNAGVLKDIRVFNVGLSYTF